MTHSTDKDQDTNQPSATCNESVTPFSDGVEEGKATPPNLDDHRERLKEAIRTHAKNNRKVVKARRARR